MALLFTAAADRKKVKSTDRKIAKNQIVILRCTYNNGRNNNNTAELQKTHKNNNQGIEFSAFFFFGFWSSLFYCFN